MWERCLTRSCLESESSSVPELWVLDYEAWCALSTWCGRGPLIPQQRDIDGWGVPAARVFTTRWSQSIIDHHVMGWGVSTGGAEWLLEQMEPSVEQSSLSCHFRITFEIIRSFVLTNEKFQLPRKKPWLIFHCQICFWCVLHFPESPVGRTKLRKHTSHVSNGTCTNIQALTARRSGERNLSPPQWKAGWPETSVLHDFKESSFKEFTAVKLGNMSAWNCIVCF